MAERQLTACRKCRTEVRLSSVRHHLLLPNRTHKAQALARQGLDQPLLLATVAEHGAGGIDPGAQSGFGYDASLPHRGKKVVLADDVLAVPDQVKQQVEDLRFDGNRRRSANQLAAIRIERVILKQIAHVAIPGGRTWRADENSTASSAKIKEIVTAR